MYMSAVARCGDGLDDPPITEAAWTVWPPHAPCAARLRLQDASESNTAD